MSRADRTVASIHPHRPPRQAPAAGAVLALAAAALLTGCRDETPAEDALALETIVGAVEKRDYGPIFAVTYEDALWQIDALKDGSPVRLSVDPTEGTIVAERPGEDTDDAPPAGSLALSKIIETVTSDGYTNLTEVDFEDDLWEIEALRAGEPHIVHINPATGEIVAFRPEDFNG